MDLYGRTNICSLMMILLLLLCPTFTVDTQAAASVNNTSQEDTTSISDNNANMLTNDLRNVWKCISNTTSMGDLLQDITYIINAIKYLLEKQKKHVNTYLANVIMNVITYLTPKVKVIAQGLRLFFPFFAKMPFSVL